ncbi:RNA-dependent RNA polymerase [Lakamha virus]|uniref:RNA-directed RNA polymerase L n=1 Tax=Lakamha virus TaxID=2609059 RepID=A0A5C2D338_9VIRU|nr:RNA-dependent RNA polymerase [Lakamha virus]QEO75951.1 RNA-dependent RNA polymerase [Lakamha virus]
MDEKINEIETNASLLETGYHAAKFYNKTMRYRHDVFGILICQSLDIEYRDDVDIREIEAILLNKLNIQLDKIDMDVLLTPDNIKIDEKEKIVYIIDYKVTTSVSYIDSSFKKYYNGFKFIENYGVKLEVVLLSYNPITKTVYISNRRFLNIENIDFTNVDKLTEILQTVDLNWQQDETYAAEKSYTVESLTDPWTDIEYDLNNDRRWLSIIENLDKDERELIEKCVNMELNSNKEINYEPVYSNYIKQTEPYITNEIDKQIMKFGLIDSCSVPTETILNQAWSLLEKKIIETKATCSDILKAKPSLHVLWSPNKSNIDTSNFMKMTSLVPILFNLKTQGSTQNFLRKISRDLDLTDKANEYERAVLEQKALELGKRRHYIKVGEAEVFHDMQFKMPNFPRRQEFLANCGIGISKDGFCKVDNPEIKKPFNINPFDMQVQHQAEHIIKATERVLFKQHTSFYKKNSLVEYLLKIKESATDECYQNLGKVLHSDYYRCIVDTSTLLRNALVMSEVNSYHSYRLVFSASTSTFLILLPNVDIKYSNSTLCFITVTFHKDKLHYTGIEDFTEDLGSGYKVTVSRPVRLDKDRVRRLVEAPYVFLLICYQFIVLGYKNISEICNYAFYSSQNVTKSLLTLTEPGKYILLSSAAQVSDAYGYITDKFEPSTKTLFSIYIFNKIKKASYIANTELRQILTRKIVVADEELKSRGFSDKKNIKSILFENEIISLKDYLTEIIIPFYMNSKGLHEYHHNIIELVKVPCEIELEVKNLMDCFKQSAEQTIDAKIFLHSACEYFRGTLKTTNNLRTNIETKGKFLKPICSISTMTSSKSILKVGDFKRIKTTRRATGLIEKNVKKREHKIIGAQLQNKNWAKTNIRIVKTKACDDVNDAIFLIIDTKNQECKNLLKSLKIKLFLNNTEIFKTINGQNIIILKTECLSIDNWSEKQAEILKIIKDNNYKNVSFSSICNLLQYTEFELRKEREELINIFKNEKAIFIDILTDIESNRFVHIDNEYVYTDNFYMQTGKLYRHADYEDLSKNIPNYQDYITTKVYDELYLQSKSFQDTNFCKIAFDKMNSDNQIWVTLFPKDQRTAKDREIYIMELDTKIRLYLLEKIYAEYSKVDITEMISQPGDTKNISLENARSRDLMFLTTNARLDSDNKGSIYEINADMSKWSAKDLTIKYMLLVCLDPNLYSNEKKLLIRFLMNYTNKNLIIPDSAMYAFLDQKIAKENDPISTMTQNYKNNFFKVSQNWLQGNLNYTSSFCHSIAMRFYKKVLFKFAFKQNIQLQVNNFVHSDDNQTSIAVSCNNEKFTQDYDTSLAKWFFDTLKWVQSCYSWKLNTKKTVVFEAIKEFVSMFNLNGEPFSCYIKYLLPTVGACAYLGPYEDLSARLSGVQTALRNGCPPSLAWLTIAALTDMTYTTYSMNPGQINDPLKIFPIKDRFSLPIELGGFPNFQLSDFMLLGIESHDINNLYVILQNNNQNDLLLINSIEEIKEYKFNMSKLNSSQIFLLKYYIVFGFIDAFDVNNSLGETFEMKSKSIITPRKFTTMKILNKLSTYLEFGRVSNNTTDCLDLLVYMQNNLEILVTKCDTMEQFEKNCIFRYFSRTFRESISTQNATQLFLEHILHSKRECIDRDFLKKYTQPDTEIIEKAQLMGKISILECLIKLNELINNEILTTDLINGLYISKFNTDPIIITLVNCKLNQIQSISFKKEQFFSQRMPDIRTIRNFINSPSEIIRTWLKIYKNNNEDLSIDETLKMDAFNLDTFIKENNMLKDIDNVNNDLTEIEKKKENISKWTKILLSCYTYISQIGLKSNTVYLPEKTKSLIDYIALVQGTFIKDMEYVRIFYKVSPLSTSAKAYINKGVVKEKAVASNIFKSILHSVDMYIKNEYKIKFINEIITNCSYLNYSLKTYYNYILSDQSLRQQFLPLLAATGDLIENDIITYKTQSRDITATWNREQIMRHGNIGPISVNLSGSSVRFDINGIDNELNEIIIYTDRGSEQNIIFQQESAILKMIPQQLDVKNFKRKAISTEYNDYIIIKFIKGRPVLFLKTLNEVESDYSLKILCGVIYRTVNFDYRNFQNILINYRENPRARFLDIGRGISAYVKRTQRTYVKDINGQIDQTGNLDLLQIIKSLDILLNKQEFYISYRANEIFKAFKCNNIGINLNIPREINEEFFLDLDEDIKINTNLDYVIAKKVKSTENLPRRLTDVFTEALEYSEKLNRGDYEKRFYRLLNIILIAEHLGYDQKNYDINHLKNALHIYSLKNDIFHAEIHKGLISKRYLSNVIEGSLNLKNVRSLCITPRHVEEDNLSKIFDNLVVFIEKELNKIERTGILPEEDTDEVPKSSKSIFDFKFF